jgi:hypothetical protein
MNLVLSCGLAPKTDCGYDRGFMPNADKWDILRYTLASYAVLPWTTKRIYVTLEPPYDRHQAELEEYVQELFGIAVQTQLNRQRQWLALCEELQQEVDPAVFFFCNHDHPFVGADLTQFQEAGEKIRRHPTPAAVYASHWPEIARGSQSYGPLELLPDGWLLGTQVQMDSITILHRELLRQWWSTKQVPEHQVMYRTDWGPMGHGAPYPVYISPRELCRHFDGQSHLFQAADAPPLSVPTGFFEREIRIAYGHPENLDGYVNLNPLRPNRTGHPGGADYRWTLEDLPLFWRDRISEVNIYPGADLEALRQARNAAVRWELAAPSQSDYLRGKLTPAEWLPFTER